MQGSILLSLLVCILTASALPLTSRSPSSLSSSPLVHSRSIEEGAVSDPRSARQASDCTGETCHSNSTALTTEGTTDEDTETNSTASGEEDMASSQGACRSLKELLEQEYGRLDDLKVDNSVFPFFVYPDVFHMERENMAKKDSQTSRQEQLRNCYYLKLGLDELSKNSICSRNYTCRYVPNEFPHYQLEAKRCSKSAGLDSEVANRVKCTPQLQDIHYAKKDGNGCWTAHDKTVRLGCKCELKAGR